MKITEEEKKYLKEILVKHRIKEGFIAQLFSKILTKTLKSNPNFMNALTSADASMDKTRKELKRLEANGLIISDPWLRKWAGLDK